MNSSEPDDDAQQTLDSVLSDTPENPDTSGSEKERDGDETGNSAGSGSEEVEGVVSTAEIGEVNDETSVEDMSDSSSYSGVGSSSIAGRRERILGHLDGGYVSMIKVLILLSIHGIADMAWTVVQWVERHSVDDIGDGFSTGFDEITPEKGDSDMLIAAFVYVAFTLLIGIFVFGLLA